MSVKKEAKLLAREMSGVQEGKGEEDLRCKSLLTVRQRRLGLSEDDEAKRFIKDKSGREVGNCVKGSRMRKPGPPPKFLVGTHD